MEDINVGASTSRQNEMETSGTEKETLDFTSVMKEILTFEECELVARTFAISVAFDERFVARRVMFDRFMNLPEQRKQEIIENLQLMEVKAEDLKRLPSNSGHLKVVSAVDYSGRAHFVARCKHYLHVAKWCRNAMVEGLVSMNNSNIESVLAEIDMVENAPAAPEEMSLDDPCLDKIIQTANELASRTGAKIAIAAVWRPAAGQELEFFVHASPELKLLVEIKELKSIVGQFEVAWADSLHEKKESPAKRGKQQVAGHCENIQELADELASIIKHELTRLRYKFTAHTLLVVASKKFKSIAFAAPALNSIIGSYRAKRKIKMLVEEKEDEDTPDDTSPRLRRIAHKKSTKQSEAEGPKTKKFKKQ